MSVKRGGLGRNLSALLSHSAPILAPASTATDVMRSTLKVHCLQPGKYQPRGDMDETALAELADSIKKQGLLQPIVVREIAPNSYEIIAGERRWRACQLAGFTDVDVVIRQMDDETAMAVALIENLQREDLNVMDQARAMQRLISEFGLTHQQIAELLCKSRTAVSNYLRLLNLNIAVRRMLEYGDIDMGHARCLLMLDDEQQLQVAELVIAKGLSVRETETMVARIKSNKPILNKKEEGISMPLFIEQLNMLSQRLQTKVNLKQGKAGKGTLVIHYNDTENLEKLMEQLGL